MPLSDALAGWSDYNDIRRPLATLLKNGYLKKTGMYQDARYSPSEDYLTKMKARYARVVTVDKEESGSK